MSETKSTLELAKERARKFADSQSSPPGNQTWNSYYNAVMSGYRAGIEDAAKLMVEKFHKVSRRTPHTYGDGPAEFYSPFEEAILSILKEDK